MAYNKLIIYYFSGTGNSRNVAHWVSGYAKEHEIESEIYDISKIDRRSVPQPDPDALIVFISPIHGFNYPPVMLNFIRHFPRGKNHIMLMNTRAGMLIGKFITPGLTGVAFYLSSLLLKIKGYSIKALYPVDLPSNWISVHPGLNERTVRFLHEKNKERVKVVCDKVFSGKRYFKKSAFEALQDIAVSPISLLYYIIGRFIIAKTYYASRDCNNCDSCIKGCPVKAIIKVDNRPFWTFRCESCMKCMSHCPKKAIETAHGSFIGYAFLNSLLIALFYKYSDAHLFKLENQYAKFIFESLVFIILFAVWYRILHYCMRFRFFERIIVYTSLTKFKFWGRRYKALKY